MPFFKGQNGYRFVTRYREIVEVLIRHGFGFVVQQLDLDQYIPLSSRFFRKRRKSPVPFPRRFRMVLEELGPTFIKLGQIMSTRPDLVPEDYIQELESLQDSVAPVEFERIRKVLAEELGEGWEDNFAEFSETPAAAASIGQVHTAVKSDGSRVAVKVQRPDIENKMKADLSIMFHLAELVEQRTKWGDLYQPIEIVEEFQRVITDELDYRLEARNTERFRQQFAENPNVKIPNVHWALTRRRVLTLDRIGGVKVSNFREKPELLKNVDKSRVARLGAESFLEQVMIHGFFHGDPHPGNLFILEGGRLGFIDFGIVGQVEERRKRQLADFFIAFTHQDVDKLVDRLLEMGLFSGNGEPQGLREDLRFLLERYYDRPLKEIYIGEVMKELTELAHRYRTRMPRDFILLSKALMTIEGVGRDLDPDFNVLDVAKPFAARLITRRLDIRERIGEILTESRSYWDVLIKFPLIIDEILTQLRDGDLELVKIDLGLDKIASRLDIVTNRLAMSMIVSAIIIASSLIVLSESGPSLWGFPAFGILGFVLAFIFGVFLIISILRSGRF